MRNIKKKVPRVEVGRWEEHEIHDKSHIFRRFGDRKVVLSGCEIRLKAGNKTLARYPREQPPKKSWGATCDEIVTFSEDARWVWHLGYHNGRARLALLEGRTLKLVGTHDPITDDRAEMRQEPLQDWCELGVSVTDAAPDMLVAFGNSGDTFAFLMTLQATSKGIVDPVGTKVFNVAADQMDERIWDAAFISSERLVVLDDIGHVTLISWPAAKPIARYAIESGLQDEKYNTRVWPDNKDADERILVDRILGCVGDTLLLSVREPSDSGSAGNLLALVALNANTLAPLGLVRPPKSEITKLLNLGKDRFGALTSGGKLHSWKLVVI
jgi:hypothetical protein